ncbi:MAG TPA: DUF2277 domain-containing protein [Polyangiaceae bacterium]|jgi:hypothetical protein
MCRNIRVLHNFQPPTTKEEIHAAALQYVRKVSGATRPSQADQDAFEQAVTEVAAVTERLLGSLTARAAPRTREGEQAKARARWTLREARMRAPGR